MEEPVELGVLEAPRVHWDYTPDPFDLPVTLVFGAESRYRLPFFPRWGWLGFLPHTTKCAVIDGDHSGVTGHQSAKRVAALIG